MYEPMKEIIRPPKRIINTPSLRRAWLIQIFTDIGRSLASVARANGVARVTIYNALDRPYPRMERIIAHELGLTAQELFPERYGPDGKPNRRLGRPVKSSNKNKPIGVKGNGKSRRVA